MTAGALREAPRSDLRGRTLDELAIGLGYHKVVLPKDDSEPSIFCLGNGSVQYAEIARNVGLLIEQNAEPRNYGALIQVGITTTFLKEYPHSKARSNIDFFELRRTLHGEDSQELMDTFRRWAGDNYNDSYVYWCGKTEFSSARKEGPVRKWELVESVRERVQRDLGNLSFSYKGLLLVVFLQDDGRARVSDLNLYR